MADFPRVRIHITSVERPLDEALVSRSRAGRVRVRRLFPAPTREYHVALRGLTDAERDSVETFLAVNRAVPFNLMWPRGNVVQQVVWIGSEIQWQDQGNRLSATDLVFALAS